VSDPKGFVDDCYRRLLGRPADPPGLDHYVGEMEGRMSPAEVVMSLATSQEYKQRILASASPRRRRPDRYRLAVDVSGTSPFLAFDVNDPSDFDWLEAAIIDDGYYEHVGVWSLEPDDDKRIMGELLASLRPRRALELGCSSGTVLRVLAEHGVDADGVEISRMAYDHARPDVRAHIHVGDLLELELPSDYDLVFGLDVFEHLNPNRLGQYLDALHSRLRPGGCLFANIPALGRDEVFGEVFPVYFREWQDDIAANRPFRVLHCDDEGYPMNGHLIWAHTTWWIAQFEAVGFARQPTEEMELHERFGFHFREAPARRSFYVFRAIATRSQPA
jgi:SAM-dependent methyltransferase